MHLGVIGCSTGESLPYLRLGVEGCSITSALPISMDTTLTCLHPSCTPWPAGPFPSQTARPSGLGLFSIRPLPSILASPLSPSTLG